MSANLRNCVISLCLLLVVLSGPGSARDQGPDGGFSLGDGRWLTFKLPTMFPRTGNFSRRYTAVQKALELQVYTLKGSSEVKVSLEGAQLDPPTRDLMIKLVRQHQVQRLEYPLGILTSRNEVWGEQKVIRVENVLPERTEQIVFRELDGDFYAFVFRPRKQVDMENAMRTVVLSSRHTKVRPVLNRAKSVRGRKEGPTARELALIQCFGILFVALLLFASVSRGAERAYDACRARRRVSIRESFRIFWSTFGLLLATSVFYLGMVYAKWSLAGTFLTPQDLTTRLLVPGLLLVVMCSAFAVIGARVGFHRSKRLSQLGSTLGVLIGLVASYQALAFVLV